MRSTQKSSVFCNANRFAKCDGGIETKRENKNTNNRVLKVHNTHTRQNRTSESNRDMDRQHSSESFFFSIQLLVVDVVLFSTTNTHFGWCTKPSINELQFPMSTTTTMWLTAAVNRRHHRVEWIWMDGWLDKTDRQTNGWWLFGCLRLHYSFTFVHHCGDVLFCVSIANIGVEHFDYHICHFLPPFSTNCCSAHNHRHIN